MTGDERDPQVKAMVGIPFSDKVFTRELFLSWMAFAAQRYHVQVAEGPVPLARQQLVETCLNGDWTHLVMLDLDHVHEPDVPHKLLRWVGADPEPKVVGGLHYQRKEPWRPCAFMFANEELDLDTVTKWKPGSLIKVDAVGGGTLMVAREVLEALEPPHFPFSYVPMAGGGQKFIGEDIWFCYRVGQLGYDVWCDTSVTSPHQGVRWVTEKDFRQWLAENPPGEAPREVETKGFDLVATEPAAEGLFSY